MISQLKESLETNVMQPSVSWTFVRHSIIRVLKLSSLWQKTVNIFNYSDSQPLGGGTLVCKHFPGHSYSCLTFSNF